MTNVKKKQIGMSNAFDILEERLLCTTCLIPLSVYVIYTTSIWRSRCLMLIHNLWFPLSIIGVEITLLICLRSKYKRNKSNNKTSTQDKLK